MLQTIKTYLQREHKKHPAVCYPRTLCLRSLSQCRSLCMKKVGVVLRQAWRESQWTVLMGYLTISTNVRCHQTHLNDIFFLSGRQRTGAHALCMQHSATAAALSTLSPEPCPQQPRVESIYCKIYGVIQQREYES